MINHNFLRNVFTEFKWPVMYRYFFTKYLDAARSALRHLGWDSLSQCFLVSLGSSVLMFHQTPRLMCLRKLQLSYLSFDLSLVTRDWALFDKHKKTINIIRSLLHYQLCRNISLPNLKLFLGLIFPDKNNTAHFRLVFKKNQLSFHIFKK